MEINGTIFSKPQQDQLKRGIGTELDKVVAKVDDLEKRIPNRTKITFTQTGVMSKQDKERLIEAIKTDPNAIIHCVYHGATMILRPLDDTLAYPKIGGVVEGSTPSTMGFVSGAVVPMTGNINFKIYSGNTATDGTLAYSTEQLSLTDVVFLK